MYPGRTSNPLNPTDHSRISEFTDGPAVGIWNWKEPAPPGPVKVCLSAQQFLFFS